MILKNYIFRAYDIRGEAFIDFDADGFFQIARAFAQHIQEKHANSTPRIFVSGDARTSMASLYPWVISGLKHEGAHVTFGGNIPTPMNYFMRYEGAFDAIIQISASHNPPKDNGLKMKDVFGPICGDEIQEIYNRVQTLDEIKKPIAQSPDTVISESQIVSAYKKKLHSILPSLQSKKIEIDCGNSIPGIFYPDLFREFGQKVGEIYCDLDTRFPNHQPDPERAENVADLIAHMKTESADFGFAFDGDGDRIGIILSDGTRLSADKILYILSIDFLSRNPKGSIVVDAMCSNTLIENIKTKGGMVHVSRTGHAYIHETMKRTGSLFGGEQSGHFMFGENFYGHDDALLAGLRFLQAVESHPHILSEVTTQWKKMHEFSEKITVDDAHKFEILQRVSTQLSQKYPDALTTDGIRISFSDYEWAIVRCSNTTPKINIRIETETVSELERRKEELLSLIEKEIKSV